MTASDSSSRMNESCAAEESLRISSLSLCIFPFRTRRHLSFSSRSSPLDIC